MASKKALAVFAGGGTRVIALIGALERLQGGKVFEFEAFAGVSAGSLLAFLSNIGRPAEDMLTYVARENLMDLVDPYGFPEGVLFWLYHRFAKQDKQNRASLPSMNPIAKKIVGALIERRIKRSDHLLQGQALEEWVRRIVKDQSVKYFRELKKELLIVTFDLAEEREFIFSRSTTPNAEIAFAITASMSAWPLFPIKKYFDREHNQTRLLADGGLWNKFPFNIFKNLYDNIPTVGFRLTSSEATHRDRLDIQLSGTPLSQLSPRLQCILALVDTILSKQDGLHLTEYEKWWTISVDTKRFATLAFDTCQEDIQNLLQRGQDEAEEFLRRIREEEQPKKTASEKRQAIDEGGQRRKTPSSINPKNIFQIFKRIFNRST